MQESWENDLHPIDFIQVSKNVVDGGEVDQQVTLVSLNLNVEYPVFTKKEFMSCGRFLCSSNKITLEDEIMYTFIRNPIYIVYFIVRST